MGVSPKLDLSTIWLQWGAGSDALACDVQLTSGFADLYAADWAYFLKNLPQTNPQLYEHAVAIVVAALLAQPLR